MRTLGITLFGRLDERHFGKIDLDSVDRVILWVSRDEDCVRGRDEHIMYKRSIK